MLKTRNIDLQGKVVAVSGSGNVAQYTVEKLITLGAKVVTMSDSDGYIYDPDGIDREKLEAKGETDIDRKVLTFLPTKEGKNSYC